MTELHTMDIRQLQLECARVLCCISGTNANLSKYNKLANHDSQQWYRVVIQSYVDQHGGLPSVTGPGKDIKLVYDV